MSSQSTLADYRRSHSNNSGALRLLLIASAVVAMLVSSADTALARRRPKRGDDSNSGSSKADGNNGQANRNDGKPDSGKGDQGRPKNGRESDDGNSGPADGRPDNPGDPGDGYSSVEGKKFAKRFNASGRRALRLRDYRDAVAKFKKALSFDNHPRLRLNLGIAHLKNKQVREARDEGLMVLADPRSEPITIAGARELVDLTGSEYDQVRKTSFKQVQALAPPPVAMPNQPAPAANQAAKERARAHFQDGQIFGNNREFAKAAESFEKALAEDLHPDILNFAAKAWHDSGKLLNARRRALEALNHPEATQDQKNVAYVRLNQISQDPRLAFQLANESIGDGNPSDLAGAGKILAENGLQANATMTYLAARAFEKSGDIERAAATFRDLLNKPEFNLEKNKPLQAEARDFLKEHDLNEKPRYEHVRNVQTPYTFVSAESSDGSPLPYVPTNYAKEERAPEYKPDVTGRVQSVLNGWTKRDEERSRLVEELGPNVDVDLLMVQAAVLSDPKADPAVLAKQLQDAGFPDVNLPDDLSRFDTSGAEALESPGVEYLKSTAERDRFRVDMQVADSGERLLTHGQNNVLLDTRGMSTVFSGQGAGIYVMSPDGKIFVNSHRLGNFHHSSFLAGGPAAGAGEMVVTDGKIQKVTNKTGHYFARMVELAQTLKQIQSDDGLGQSLNGIQIGVYGLYLDANGERRGEVRPWDGDAQNFLDTFESRRGEFEAKFKALGFDNDPYEHLKSPAVNAPPDDYDGANEPLKPSQDGYEGENEPLSRSEDGYEDEDVPLGR